MTLGCTSATTGIGLPISYHASCKHLFQEEQNDTL